MSNNSLRTEVMTGVALVSATYMESEHTKQLMLTLGDHRTEEFKEALRRSLNTWDNAPGWLFELARMLENGVKPHSDRAKAGLRP